MSDALLDVRALDAFYGDFQALFGISLRVAAGEAVAVIGANGAGKSTLLNSIAGLLRAEPDAIAFDGVPIGALPAYAVAARGIALVPEGRRLFASLTVEENLLIGGQLRRPGPWNLARIFELFPALAERRAAPSTALSGEQQQMAAIGTGADGKSKTSALRRDQPRACADRGARDLRVLADSPRRRNVTGDRRARHRASA